MLPMLYLAAIAVIAFLLSVAALRLRPLRGLLSAISGTVGGAMVGAVLGVIADVVDPGGAEAVTPGGAVGAIAGALVALTVARLTAPRRPPSSTHEPG
jgi:hypothetical protein